MDLAGSGRHVRAVAALMVIAGLGACVGPMPTRSGGQASPPIADVSPAADLKLTSAQWDVLNDALRNKGVMVTTDSGQELTVTLTERDARIGVTGAGNSALAPPKKQRLLQKCQDRTVRLVLSVADKSSGGILGRGWAEESHCKGEVERALPRLARDAVSMLTTPGADAVKWYWRED